MDKSKLNGLQEIVNIKVTLSNTLRNYAPNTDYAKGIKYCIDVLTDRIIELTKDIPDGEV